LAWHPDGETVFVASLDGSIMAAKFEIGELGYPAAVSKNEEALSKFGAGRKAGIVEGTDALMLEESSKAGELKGVQGRMGELMGDGASHAAPLTNGTTPYTNGASTFSTTATNGTNAPPTPAPSQQAAQDVRINKLKQRVTIGPDGKKRIAPLLVSSSAGLAESSLPQSQLVQGAAQGMRSDVPHNVLDLSKPYDGFPKGGLAALLVGNKRKFADIDGDHDRRIERRMADSVRDGGAPIVMNGTDGLIPPSMAVPKSTEIDIPGALRPAIVSPALTVSQVRLAVPIVRSVILRTVDGSEPPKTTGSEAPTNDDTTILEARNASGP